MQALRRQGNGRMPSYYGVLGVGSGNKEFSIRFGLVGGRFLSSGSVRRQCLFDGKVLNNLLAHELSHKCKERPGLVGGSTTSL